MLPLRAAVAVSVESLHPHQGQQHHVRAVGYDAEAWNIVYTWFDLRPLKIALQLRIQKTLSEMVISHYENITRMRAIGDSNGFTGNHG